MINTIKENEEYGILMKVKGNKNSKMPDTKRKWELWHK